MGVDEKTRALKVEFAGVIEQILIEGDGDDIRHKNVMRAGFDLIENFALERHGAVFDGRRADFFGWGECETGFRGFINLFPGDGTAIVNDFDEGRGGKIDDELAG